MTSELRPAALVAHEVCEEMEEYGPAFAERVIKADREAVRAEQAAELAKWKALAETLAGALPDDIDLFRIIRRAGRSDREKAQAVYAHLSQALTSYKEQRDD